MKLLGSERSIEQTKDLNYNPMVFHKLILSNNDIIATGSQLKTHTHTYKTLTFHMLRDQITIITTGSQLRKSTRPALSIC